MKTFVKILLILLSLVSVFFGTYSLVASIDAFNNGWAIIGALVLWIYSGISIVVNLIINLILIKKREFRFSFFITLGAIAITLISIFIGLVILPAVR